MGVKQAVPLGAIVDGIIDFVGVMISPGANPQDAIKKLLGIITKTRKGVDPTLDAFNNVVRATLGLGQIIEPAIGSGFTPLGLFRLAAKAPQILAGVTNVFASLLGLWGAVEPFIPQAKPVLPVDPAFRNQVRKFNRSKILPLDPGLRRGLEPTTARRFDLSTITPRPRTKAKFEGRREVAPDTGEPLTDSILQILGEAQEKGLRLPDGIEIKTVLVPGTLQAKQRFLNRFKGDNATDLRAVIEQLKKDA